NNGSVLALIPWLAGVSLFSLGLRALAGEVRLGSRFLLLGLGTVAFTEALAQLSGIALIRGAGLSTTVDASFSGTFAEANRLAGALGDYELLAEMMMLCTLLGAYQ